MRTRIPRYVVAYAASVGVMTALLVGSLAVCAAPILIRAALFR